MHHSDIIIPDRIQLAHKLDRFHLDTTRVVADFDGTMTHPHPTSWKLMEGVESHIPGYSDATTRFYEKFHRYELNHTLSREEKTRYMQLWWESALSVFKKLGLKEEHLDTIDVSHVELREGIAEAFAFFAQENIPVLILSAGIQQTIEKVLAYHHLESSNVTLVANELLFDQEGDYVGSFPEGHIHAGNKDEHHATGNIQTQMHNRSQIILIGDSLHDITMIPQSERKDTIAIGYCHANRRDIIEEYIKIFDIVVASDSSDLGVLRYLLQRIR